MPSRNWSMVALTKSDCAKMEGSVLDAGIHQSGQCQRFLFAMRTVLPVLMSLVCLALNSAVHAESVFTRAIITVRVLDVNGVGVRGMPIVADRQRIERSSPAACGWTNDDGIVTLDVLIKQSELSTNKVAADQLRIPIRIAPVAPGCQTRSKDDEAASSDWTRRLDTLMITNAFPDKVDAVVSIAADAASSEATDNNQPPISVSVDFRAVPAVRVVATVRHLRDRILFCTPERVGAFNPMWELFKLAERVPTDQVVMDGVPMFTGEGLHQPTLIRLVSSGKVVSRIVGVPLDERETLTSDDGTRQVVNLGTITLPQDIAKYPIDENVTVLAKDGSAKRLEPGRAVALTLCAVDGSHQGLLWHIDVMGGASGSPKPGSLDQRAHMPEGLFAVVPTQLLDSPSAFARFLQAAQSSDWQRYAFPLLKVEPGKSSTLVFEEKAGRDALGKVLNDASSNRAAVDVIEAHTPPK
ncbi:MAG: hypothetical protein U0640_10075 [Phycisphaerales bacterium]